MKVLENLEVVQEGTKKIFRCGKCQHNMGPASEGYRVNAIINEIPREWGQEDLPIPKSKLFVFRQFCCPKCGAQFEVDLSVKGSRIMESIRLF